MTSKERNSHSAKLQSVQEDRGMVGVPRKERSDKNKKRKCQANNDSVGPEGDVPSTAMSKRQ